MLKIDDISAAPPVLRDYQTDLGKNALAALKEHGSAVIQLATGAGKTFVASELIRNWRRAGNRVWFVCHRRELVKQASEEFDKFLITHGIIAAGVEEWPKWQVFVCSIGSLRRRWDRLQPPDIVIMDECHHAPAGTWMALRKKFPKAQYLGLTATPWRLDGKPLSEAFAKLTCGPSSRWLRQHGYLADFRYFAPVMPDLSGVKVRDGDYDRAALDEVMSENIVVGDVVEHYNRLASGRRAIMFAVSVKASLELVARFAAAGVPAKHIDAKTPDDERAAAVEDLRDGRVKVLSNVEIFTEGFNLPELGAVILMRPTRSLTLYTQMVGRVMRPKTGEDDAVVLDHAGCCDEHGLPDEEYDWSLDGSPPRRHAGTRERLRRCTECNHVHAWSGECPDCGHEYTGAEREVTEVGGTLREVGAPPPGLMTKMQYAKSRNLSSGGLWFRMTKGMPTETGGFIDPVQADVWHLQRSTLTKKVRAERARARLNDPVYKAKFMESSQTQSARSKRSRSHQSSELREAKAATLKRIRDTPECRAKMAENSRRRMTDPLIKAKVLAALHSDVARACAAESNRQREGNPEEIAKARERGVRRMADPSVKAKFLAASQSLETNLKRKVARKAFLSNPENKAKAVAQMHSPEAHAKMGAATRIRMSDPAERESARIRLNSPDSVAKREETKRRNAINKA